MLKDVILQIPLVKEDTNFYYDNRNRFIPMRVVIARSTVNMQQ